MGGKTLDEIIAGKQAKGVLLASVLAGLLVAGCSQQSLERRSDSPGVLLHGRIRVVSAGQAQVANVEAFFWPPERVRLRVRHPFSGQALWEARSNGKTFWLKPVLGIKESRLARLLSGLELQVLLSGVPPKHAKKQGNISLWQGRTATGVLAVYRGKLQSDGRLLSWQQLQNNQPVMMVEYLAYTVLSQQKITLPQRMRIQLPAADLEALLAFSRHQAAPHPPHPFIPDR